MAWGNGAPRGWPGGFGPENVLGFGDVNSSVDGSDVWVGRAGLEWRTASPAASVSWTSISYGNGLYVAVATNGSIMTSPDAENWTSQTSPAALYYTSVTFGKGMFVAVARSGTGNRAMYSPDGINWTSASISVDRLWKGVTFGIDRFVAVGDTNRVIYSYDGINWTEVAGLPTDDWLGVFHGNGLFVAHGEDNLYPLATSPDGIVWTARTVPLLNYESGAYGNGIYVCVASNGTDHVITSPDGITWTQRSDGYATLSEIAFAQGIFVALADSNLNTYIVSEDGINWTVRNLPVSHAFDGLCFGNGQFVAVSQSSPYYVLISGRQDKPPERLENRLNGLWEFTDDLHLFPDSIDSVTPEFKISGYRTGDALRTAVFQVDPSANDMFRFSGPSVFRFYDTDVHIKASAGACFLRWDGPIANNIQATWTESTSTFEIGGNSTRKILLSFGNFQFYDSINSKTIFEYDSATTDWDFGDSTLAHEFNFKSTSAGKLNVNSLLFLLNVKSGATQVGAGAAAGEVWETSGHATLPDHVLLLGV